RKIANKVLSRAEAGLPETGFVFSAYTGARRIAPDVFGVWMRLLNSVENSVLWLQYSGPAATTNLRREAKLRGIARERILFAPRVEPEQHLARLRLADLFLDTLPYNAQAPITDALWLGLPVVTCLGNSFAGRVAASLLRAAALPELVTTSLAE